MMLEQKSFIREDALTFRPANLCSQCKEGVEESNFEKSGNNFDFELEKTLQTKILFEKEAIREQVREEVVGNFNSQLQLLKGVNIMFS